MNELKSCNLEIFSNTCMYKRKNVIQILTEMYAYKAVNFHCVWSQACICTLKMCYVLNSEYEYRIQMGNIV